MGSEGKHPRCPKTNAMNQLANTLRNCPPYLLAIAGTVAVAIYAGARLLAILHANGLPS